MKLTIKARGERFRRAGIAFESGGTEIETDDLTVEQLEALRDETQLVCPSDLDGVIEARFESAPVKGKGKKAEGAS
ncbi:hypothetical protein HC761_00095 [bacterium]|nr:hypothetical protein [bacterium]